MVSTAWQLWISICNDPIRHRVVHDNQCFRVSDDEGKLRPRRGITDVLKAAYWASHADAIMRNKDRAAIAAFRRAARGRSTRATILHGSSGSRKVVIKKDENGKSVAARSSWLAARTVGILNGNEVHEQMARVGIVMGNRLIANDMGAKPGQSQQQRRESFVEECLAEAARSFPGVQLRSSVPAGIRMLCLEMGIALVAGKYNVFDPSVNGRFASGADLIGVTPTHIVIIEVKTGSALDWKIATARMGHSLAWCNNDHCQQAKVQAVWTASMFNAMHARCGANWSTVKCLTLWLPGEGAAQADYVSEQECRHIEADLRRDDALLRQAADMQPTRWARKKGRQQQQRTPTRSLTKTR
jgi:hypothetical protein